MAPAALRVGPHSAGSEPGPACYGRGGERPTVTDASVVLGCLDPAYFAGGTLRLAIRTLAHAADRASTIARPLGMTRAKRRRSASIGCSTRRWRRASGWSRSAAASIRAASRCVPLGGAGPMHATALAAELGIGSDHRAAAIPGVLSAAGLLAAPVEHEVAAAFPRPLAGCDLRGAGRAARRAGRCAPRLDGGRKARRRTDVAISYFADICYIGQSYHLEVPLPDAGPRRARSAVSRLPGGARPRLRTRTPSGRPAIVNLRSVHRPGGGGRLDEDMPPAAPPTARKPARAIRVCQSERARCEAAIWQRAACRPRRAFAGPAIIEQADTTTLVEPGWRGTRRRPAARC